MVGNGGLDGWCASSMVGHVGNDQGLFAAIEVRYLAVDTGAMVQCAIVLTCGSALNEQYLFVIGLSRIYYGKLWLQTEKKDDYSA